METFRDVKAADLMLIKNPGSRINGLLTACPSSTGNHHHSSGRKDGMSLWTIECLKQQSKNLSHIEGF